MTRKKIDMKHLTDKTDYVLGTYSDMEERLMDIEDILGDDYDLDRLRALTKADREERIFISPVKIGDTVYYITGLYGNLVKPATVEEVYFGDSTLALGVSTGFAKFPLLEKEFFITKEAAEDALQHMQMEE